MHSGTYRMALAIAAFTAFNVAGGVVQFPTDRFAAGTARAQSDPANRTLRFAPTDIARATHRVDDMTRTSVLEIRLSREAAARLRDFTTTHVGRKVDLKVDGRVLSSPVIQTPITGDAFVVTGNFSVDQARAMVAAIKAGNAAIEFSLADEPK